MNTEITETTFNLPAENLPGFQAKMKKLSRRAKKLAVLAFLGFEIVRTFTKKGSYVDSLGIVRETENVFHEVRAWGPSVKINGWAFVGRLDYKTAPGATLRMMVPGETCPPAMHDAPATRCDHCGHKRRRNDTFILRHDDGRETVVGRTCLGDFLGHATPEQLARIAELPMLVGYFGGEDEKWARPVEVWNPTQVLATALFSIREYGWAASREEGSTRDTVLDLLTPESHPKDEAARVATLQKVTDTDWATAGEAIAWIVDVDTSRSDYLHNLRAVLTSAVTRKAMGIGVSGALAYSRHIEREVAKADRAAAAAAGPVSPSEHVGSVKDRIDFDAQVVHTRAFEGYYGLTTIIKLRDDDGNVFTWFASGSRGERPGERYHVRGTVKKHDEYQGEKQTVITRCNMKKAA